MSGYIGEKCLICGETFTEDSDIVVCPDCGTPYHRECYEKEGYCINEKLHAENGSWYAENNKKKEAIICKVCGSENAEGNNYCSNCGNKLNSDNGSNNTDENKEVFPGMGFWGIDLTDRLCGYKADDEIEGVTVSELADFIGDNTYYYLPIFKRMSETGKKISFNISCLFFPDYYFANRKMYFWWIPTMIFLFIISIPSMLNSMAELDFFNGYSEQFSYNNPNFNAISIICNFLLYILRGVMCLFGNWIYLKYAVKKIKAIKAESLPFDVIRKKIVSAGGVEFKNIFLNLLINVSLSIAVFSIVLLLP